MFGGNIILVATRDVLSSAIVYLDSFPAESTCVSFGRHSVNSAGFVAQHSVYCARVVRRIRCQFSVPLFLRQLILCTRHGMHHVSRKSHVSISSRMINKNGKGQNWVVPVESCATKFDYNSGARRFWVLSGAG